MTTYEYGAVGVGSSRGLGEYRGSRLNDPTGWSHAWVMDPLKDWQREGRSLAAYARNLVESDPYAQAMLEARLELTHGAQGLRFRSRYQGDDDLAISDAERATQRQIERTIAEPSEGLFLDAGGAMTRAQLERLIDRSKIINGDGFAVRVFLPGRNGAKTATAWRVVDPLRVRNPFQIADWETPGAADVGGRAPASHVIWQGIELDANMVPYALWVEIPNRKGHGHLDSQWLRVPYYSEDGSRNVIHRFDSKQAGQIRGLSDFAGLMVTLKHLKGTSEAHVVAKRSQAAQAMWIRTADPEIAANFARSGAVAGANTPVVPGQERYLGKDGEVIMPGHAYQGSDFREFVETMVRSVASSWGLPWQIVLAQMSQANLASSRAALDQAERKARGWQDAHIAQCTSVIDESILRESMVRGVLSVRGLSDAMRGHYLRPKSWSTDRSKDAAAAINQIKIGRSPDSVFAEIYGEDFEGQVRRQAENMAFAAAQGVDIHTMIGVPDASPSDEDDEQEDEPEQDKGGADDQD
jgi:capsid protein